MLAFEAALARAEAAAGLVPRAAAKAIAACCRAEMIDRERLAAKAIDAGNLAIPLVQLLTEVVRARDEKASRWVHWGATSQDVIDTAFVLQARDLLDRLEADLDRLGDALAKLARRHRRTVQTGRTLLQHALPITFGLKVAGWLDAVMRQRARFRELRPRVLVLQFGGAAGTLSALGDKGLAVAAALAKELHLELPDMPWHGARDRVAELACFCGVLTGVLGKIARDLALMSQTEVDEAREPAKPGRGGSSTLPHKRNPVAAGAVLTAAARAPGLVATVLGAMPQEHERALGGWHAEWWAMPELARLTAGALRHLAEVMPGLVVEERKMRENLDLTRGLVLAEGVSTALIPKLGRSAAKERVEALSRRAIEERRHLAELVAEDSEMARLLPPERREELFDPSRYLGVAEAFVDRVLATWKSRPRERRVRKGG